MSRLVQWHGGLVLALIVFAALVACGWVGFLGSDDAFYAAGAYGWIEHFPYVGGHGTIRYPITIPIALSFLTFGENEYALVLPSLLYMLGFLTLAWFSVRRASNSWAAFGALAALVTCPLLVVQSSISSVDIVETFFLFASTLLFWRCLEDGPDGRKLFLAGALAGLGFLTRETAIFIALFYALYFAIGYRFHRGHYLWIAVGFVAVWLAEVTYLWIMTGDPLYRINISLHHDSSIDRSIDLAGNVIVNPLLDPLLVLLANQEFMALFFLAVPLGAWLCFGRSIPGRLKTFARLVALLGLVWFVAAGAAQKLLPLNPRYFMITCASACILTGIGLALLFERCKRRWAAALVAAFIVSTNLLGIYVENKDPLFGERQLAHITSQRRGDIIHTDPKTRHRADMLLHWQHASNRVPDTAPKPGDLYLYNPKLATKPAYMPQPQWLRLQSWEPQPPLPTRIIESSGLATFIPAGIWTKLRHRHPPVTLYRVR